jgi:hypothetical protein
MTPRPSLSGSQRLRHHHYRPWRSALARLLALGLLLLASASVLAAEWTYRVRPGDTLWDLAAAHLRADVAWQQLQAHNGIADPYRLPPGSTLRVPVAWLRQQPASATIAALKGQATVVDADGTRQTAQAGARLGAGARLLTAADASLTLRFADGSRLLMHGNSELVLDRLVRFGRTGMVDTRLRLQRGRVSNDVRPLRVVGGFVVQTPQAVSSVRGTEFRLDASDTRTHAEVVHGGVHVAAGTRATLARRGHGVTVDGSGAMPARAVPLLPAPATGSLQASVQQLPVRLRWDPVPGANGYRVLVSSSRDFSTLLADLAVDTTTTPLPPLAGGQYHVAVRAVAEGGLEGLDAVSSFAASGSPEPPYAMNPARDLVVYSPAPQFSWSRPRDAASYRFELATDPEFTDVLEHVEGLRGANHTPGRDLRAGRYYWRVGSRDAEGKDGPWGAPGTFELKPLVDAGAIEDRHHGRAAAFHWSPGPAGQRYRFQLSRDADFRRLRVDELVDTPQIRVPRLGRGTWYVRAQAIAEDGTEAPMPPAQSVQVPCHRCAALLGGGALLILLVL